MFAGRSIVLVYPLAIFDNKEADRFGVALSLAINNPDEANRL